LAWDEYALSASTRSGRVRGRPRPDLRTRMRWRTGTNCGLSPRCPAVITVDSGVRPCSTARCSFVVHPPRDRPHAWSTDSAPGGSTCPGRVTAGTRGVLVHPHNRGVHRHVPTDQARLITELLQPLHDPSPHAAALPSPKQAIDRLPRPPTVRARPTTEYRHRIPARAPPADPVDQLSPSPGPGPGPGPPTPTRHR
jgi:hypothetical protein